MDALKYFSANTQKFFVFSNTIKLNEYIIKKIQANKAENEAYAIPNLTYKKKNTHKIAYMQKRNVSKEQNQIALPFSTGGCRQLAG